MSPSPINLIVGQLKLQALLGIPQGARGLIIFAHGSGSGRFSPRNNLVADALREAGFATLLLDLLSLEEEQDRANVFDIGLLADRVRITAEWSHAQANLKRLPIGLFGASTGAGAALLAAAQAPQLIDAVVSRGGRPDLAGSALHMVAAPTLLIVGSLDGPVIGMNEEALARLECQKALVIVPGAGHLFEEPGTLDQVVDHAIRWFGAYLKAPQGAKV